MARRPAQIDIEEIAQRLNKDGYIVLENPLQQNLSALLFGRCHDDGPARFHAAQVGRGLAKRQDSQIRGDTIRWLDDDNQTDHAYLVWIEKLRLGLNALLFLGLFDFESHYAIYATGSGYAKHSDVLNGSKNRILSTVLYLNEDWRAEDGGELRLFEPLGQRVIETVIPTFGKMIIFLSDSFPHEVLMAHRQRRSIAGWFRGRAPA